MFRNYITAEEFYTYYPRLRDDVNETHLQSILNSSALQVLGDIRKKDIDAMQLMIPLPFDSAKKYEVVTNTSMTSDKLSLNSERRFVVNATSVSGATFVLEGSEDGTNWTRVKGFDNEDVTLEIASAGVYSEAFVESFAYVRYILSGSASYQAFMIDVSFDTLIMLKAVQNICLPLMNGESSYDAMNNEAITRYQAELFDIRFDADANKDGAIGSDEQNVTKDYIWRR